MAHRRRPAAREAGFFDRFRSAIARLPAGLIRARPPAAPDDIARAEAKLGRALPAAYASFLRSFDGADLFHETVVIAGVGRGAPRALTALAQDRPGELVFAEALWGDRYALDADERVLRYDAGADERALAGSSFDRWLDATDRARADPVRARRRIRARRVRSLGPGGHARRSRCARPSAR